jgi:hypothetical protein
VCAVMRPAKTRTCKWCQQSMFEGMGPDTWNGNFRRHSRSCARTAAKAVRAVTQATVQMTTDKFPRAAPAARTLVRSRDLACEPLAAARIWTITCEPFRGTATSTEKGAMKKRARRGSGSGNLDLGMTTVSEDGHMTEQESPPACVAPAPSSVKRRRVSVKAPNVPQAQKAPNATQWRKVKNPPQLLSRTHPNSARASILDREFDPPVWAFERPQPHAAVNAQRARPTRAQMEDGYDMHAKGEASADDVDSIDGMVIVQSHCPFPRIRAFCLGRKDGAEPESPSVAECQQSDGQSLGTGQPLQIESSGMSLPSPAAGDATAEAFADELARQPLLSQPAQCKNYRRTVCERSAILPSLLVSVLRAEEAHDEAGRLRCDEALEPYEQ